MAIVYYKSGITGGTSDDLDGIDGSGISADDLCVVANDLYVVWYKCVATSDSEDSPWLIRPDTNPGSLGWALQMQTGQDFGHLMRPRFEWVDNTHIYVGAGRYHLYNYGTVVWDTRLTILADTATNTWSYLYLDYSDINSDGVLQIDNSYWTWSSTAPTYYHIRGGWYNGDDRCIFAVYLDGSGHVKEFFHDGGRLVQYGESVADSTTVPTTSFSSYTLTVPAIARAAQLAITFRDAATNDLYYRMVGGASSTGINLGQTLTTAENLCLLGKFLVNVSSQSVAFRAGSSGGDGFSLRTCGFYLPEGM